jgi:CheY-like chemotaxis protein
MPGQLPEPVARLVLWLVDDTKDHHLTARETVAAWPTVRFQGFLAAEDALERYAALAGGRDAQLPQVVLMDFFLGGRRGDEVTRELRALQPAHRPLIIVGYSSIASGSRAIVEAGGNLIIRKVRDRHGRNPLLGRYLSELLGSARS